MVNLASLTILGLRVIFFKAIIFNVLMTLRLWMSQCEYRTTPPSDTDYYLYESEQVLFM